MKSAIYREIIIKTILWALIAIYTFFLPDARIIYEAIVNSFGQEVAGKVPLVLVAVVGCAYTLAVFLTYKNLKNLLFLIPCALIAYLIMHLEDNPNKHIHIPEYMLMAWLLYAVLSRDYSSEDMFILIFIYTSILGVVDELEQGIHPARFYGSSDMLVNTASALIGVFTLMGLKKMKALDWAWTRRLQEFKSLVWLCLFGIAGAALTCVTLFRVQASGDFWSVYPVWLWIWNILFLILVPMMLVLSQAKLRKHPETGSRPAYILPPDVKTAVLWIIPLLVILFYIHSLLIYISISGVKFA